MAQTIKITIFVQRITLLGFHLCTCMKILFVCTHLLISNKKQNKNFSSRLQADVIFIDFAKAFDKVDHPTDWKLTRSIYLCLGGQASV